MSYCLFHVKSVSLDTFLYFYINRQLLPPDMRNPVYSQHGLLPDSDLHPCWPDRDHLLGVILVAPERDTSSGGTRCDHRAHDDHPHVQHQRRLTQDLLHQEHRRLLRHLFRYGVRLAARVCDRRLPWQADRHEKNSISAYS